jgi:signal transduction histidine kinase
VTEALLNDYLVPFGAQTDSTAETALGHAYELGRAALARRQSLLEIVTMHHAALDRALTCHVCRDERTRTLRVAGELLTELLSPFDMAQGAFLESNAALRGANDLLEREAHRIARLLHDSAGQIVFAMHLALADLDRDVPDGMRPRFNDLSRLLDQLDQQLRCHAHELYPMVLKDLGLPAALGQLIEKIRQGSGLAIQFTCSFKGRLAPDVESPVYRAVQEALTNILKHAHATEVVVTVERTGSMLTCSIVDNGVGFAPQAGGHLGPGLGLAGIRERIKAINGTVHVKSQSGQGTVIMLTVPLLHTGEADGTERHSGGRSRAGAAGTAQPARP